MPDAPIGGRLICAAVVSLVVCSFVTGLIIRLSIRIYNVIADGEDSAYGVPSRNFLEFLKIGTIVSAINHGLVAVVYFAFSNGELLHRQNLVPDIPPEQLLVRFGFLLVSLKSLVLLIKLRLPTTLLRAAMVAMCFLAISVFVFLLLAVIASMLSALLNF